MCRHEIFVRPRTRFKGLKSHDGLVLAITIVLSYKRKIDQREKGEVTHLTYIQNTRSQT